MVLSLSFAAGRGSEKVLEKPWRGERAMTEALKKQPSVAVSHVWPLFESVARAIPESSLTLGMFDLGGSAEIIGCRDREELARENQSRKR